LTPCSTDFTPRYIFLWWFTKDIAYRVEVHVNEMSERIVRAAECVTNEKFVSTCLETEYRLDVCRTTHSDHISSTEYIRNFVRSSVWKCIDFP